MKIAFDHQIFCNQAYGGISRYHVRLAEELVSMGEKVGIFAPLYRNMYLSSLPDHIIFGTKVKDYPPRTARIALLMNYVAAKHGLKQWRPQLLHETYYARRSIAPVDCPVVLTVHDMIDEWCYRRSSAGNMTKTAKQLAVERADHLICISECTKRDLINYFEVPENRVTVVYHGFEQFAPSRVAKNGMLEKKPFLLYVGKRNGYKNFDRFIQSVAASERLTNDYDIASFGGGEFSKKEMHRLHRLGFKEGQVRQIEGCDSVLANLYENASAFVFPSLYEGFGLTPLEAMAHQCPVVSSNTSCMPEIIGQAAEYFDPYSVEQITVALEKVLYSGTRISELISLGKQRLDKFSWGKCATATRAVYQNVCG